MLVVDVGGQVTQVHTPCTFLAGLHPDQRQVDFAAGHLGLELGWRDIEVVPADQLDGNDGLAIVLGHQQEGGIHVDLSENVTDRGKVCGWQPGQHRTFVDLVAGRWWWGLVIGLGNAVVGGVDREDYADQEGKGGCGEAGPEDGKWSHGQASIRDALVTGARPARGSAVLAWRGGLWQFEICHGIQRCHISHTVRVQLIASMLGMNLQGKFVRLLGDRGQGLLKHVGPIIALRQVGLQLVTQLAVGKCQLAWLRFGQQCLHGLLTQFNYLRVIGAQL